MNTVLKGFLSRIPLYAPILWLALYSTKRRSEYQRLQQEYAHKEALAKSYGSYKKQIDDLDEENIEMQKILIMKAVDAIAYNASDTLDGKHGDKMPVHDLLEKYHSLIKKIVEEIPKLMCIVADFVKLPGAFPPGTIPNAVVGSQGRAAAFRCPTINAL
ncbi:MAG: hypothetical protein ACXWT1_13615 [Methylobacter sp.]